MLDDDKVCRPCRRQAAMLRPGNHTLTVAEAAKYGHQLFFANMFIQRGLHRSAKDKTAWQVRTGVRVLLGFIDGPGVVITATDAPVLAGPSCLSARRSTSWLRPG